MTMNDRPDDSLDAVARLRVFDVPRPHADRLRRECHARLRVQPGPNRSPGPAGGTAFGRIVVPALGGAWCVVYLVEIIRVAAAAYLGAR